MIGHFSDMDGRVITTCCLWGMDWDDNRWMMRHLSEIEDE